METKDYDWKSTLEENIKNFDSTPHTIVDDQRNVLRTNYILPSLQDAGRAVAKVTVKLANKVFNTGMILILAADMAGTRPIKRILVEYEDIPVKEAAKSPATDIPTEGTK